MDDLRKSAYRHLLYGATLDIRPIAWMSFPWLRPLQWGRALRRVRYAGELANCVHNLALFSSIDFERFDEARFWQDLHHVEEKFPESLPHLCRGFFELRLKQLQTQTTSSNEAIS